MWNCKEATNYTLHDKHKYVKKLGQRVTHNTPIYSKRGIRYKEIQSNWAVRNLAYVTKLACKSSGTSSVSALPVIENHKHFYEVEQGFPLIFPLNFQNPSEQRKTELKITVDLNTHVGLIAARDLWPIRLRHETIALFQNKKKRPQSLPDESGPLISAVYKWLRYQTVCQNKRNKNIFSRPVDGLTLTITRGKVLISNFPLSSIRSLEAQRIFSEVQITATPNVLVTVSLSFWFQRFTPRRLYTQCESESESPVCRKSGDFFRSYF